VVVSEPALTPHR